MVRDVKQVDLPTKEEIISYEYYRSGSVRVTIGVGNLDGEGNFIQDHTKNERTYDIVGDNFDALMAANSNKPKDRFRVEDLWGSVDSIDSERIDIRNKDKQNQELSGEGTTNEERGIIP